MKIEIRAANRGWTWAIVAPNGRQIANNEVFASVSNAKRAAKGVVAAIIRRFMAGIRPRIVWSESTRRDGSIVLTYVADEWQEG